MKMLPSDLMIEQLEMAKMDLLKGVENQVQTLAHCVVHQVSICDEQGAKALGRAIGRYVTIETDKSYQIGEPAFEEIASALADQLKQMLQDRKRVLILGIGNPNITPDSLGSKAVERLMVTRPLKDPPKQYASVSAMAASVYGVSGIESAELAQGLVHSLSPEAVILIDAMATARLERLCQTIQLSDSGLTPGGGVDNARKEISAKTLGVPVISVGMPTVVDCRVLLWHVLGEDWEKHSVKLHPFEENLIATPRQMELATDMGARLIAFAINKALHSDLPTEEILKYLY